MPCVVPRCSTPKLPGAPVSLRAADHGHSALRRRSRPRSYLGSAARITEAAFDEYLASQSDLVTTNRIIFALVDTMLAGKPLIRRVDGDPDQAVVAANPFLAGLMSVADHSAPIAVVVLNGPSILSTGGSAGRPAMPGSGATGRASIAMAMPGLAADLCYALARRRGGGRHSD